MIVEKFMVCSSGRQPCDTTPISLALLLFVGFARRYTIRQNFWKN